MVSKCQLEELIEHCTGIAEVISSTFIVDNDYFDFILKHQCPMEKSSNTFLSIIKRNDYWGLSTRKDIILASELHLKQIKKNQLLAQYS